MIPKEKFLSLFALLLAIKYGEGIKCHVCNSKQDASCDDPFNVSSTLQECEGSQGYFGGGVGGGRTLDVIEIIMQSLKTGGGVEPSSDVAATPVLDSSTPDVPLMVCQKIVVVVGGESITGRGCSPPLVDGMYPCDAVKLSAPEHSASATPAMHVRHCVTCRSDACNAAAGVTGSPSVAIAVAVASAIFPVFIAPRPADAGR